MSTTTKLLWDTDFTSHDVVKCMFASNIALVVVRLVVAALVVPVGMPLSFLGAPWWGCAMKTSAWEGRGLQIPAALLVLQPDAVTAMTIFSVTNHMMMF
jgi:hypothetical protein